MRASGSRADSIDSLLIKDPQKDQGEAKPKSHSREGSHQKGKSDPGSEHPQVANRRPLPLISSAAPGLRKVRAGILKVESTGIDSEK